MPNASPGTLRGQVAELNRENARLQSAVTERDEQLTIALNAKAALEDEILRYAPECWGDDTGDDTAVRYVRSLEGQGSSMTGHTDDCKCWE